MKWKRVWLLLSVRMYLLKLWFWLPSPCFLTRWYLSYLPNFYGLGDTCFKIKPLLCYYNVVNNRVGASHQLSASVRWDEASDPGPYTAGLWRVRLAQLAHAVDHVALQVLLCCHLEACAGRALRGRRGCREQKLPRLRASSLFALIFRVEVSWRDHTKLRLFVFPCNMHNEIKNSTLLCSVNILLLVGCKANSELLWCRFLETPQPLGEFTSLPPPCLKV